MVAKYLPLNVLLDILCRLPVKSLKRFQCICKSWNQNLRTPYFVTQHLHFQRKNNNNNCILVSYHNGDKYDSPKPRSYFTLLHLNETTDGIISFQWLNLSTCFKVGAFLRGPFNGIYCLSNGNLFALVNVASREFKLLPDHPTISPRPGYVSIQVIEFGFDPKTNDYKVVFFTTLVHMNRNRKEISQLALVYSLSSNSWRKLNDTLLDHTHVIVPCASWSDTYVDGNVHLQAHDDGVDKSFILSFSMVDEVFRKIKLPELNWRKVWQLGIVAYNGLLSIIVCPFAKSSPSRHDKFFDIWVMQDYGNDESWTKQFKIGPFGHDVIMLGPWPNDRFLLGNDDGEVVIYDPSTQKKKKIFDEDPTVQARIYSESLVSLIGNERNEKNILFDIVEGHPSPTNPDEIKDYMPVAAAWKPYLGQEGQDCP